MIKRVCFIVAVIFIGLLSAKSQPGRLIDGIAAIVGDSIVLKSDVNEFVEMKIQASGKPADILIRKMLYDDALDALISGLVMIVHTAQDTNIVITSDMINEQVNRRIAMILNQNKLTEEQLSEVLQKEQNMSLDEFKAKIFSQTEQELVKQKVQQFYLAGAEMSREDVRTFFGEYKDSLPPAGESVKLQKLEVDVKADSVIRQEGYEKILTIRRRFIEGGEDFGELAKEYSNGPNAKFGGDLGFVSKGTLNLIALEQAIFTLQPGEISRPIETRLGWHLVTVVERKDGSVHVKHILINVSPSPSEMAEVESIIDSVRENSLDSASFASIIKKVSTDPISKAYGGVMDWNAVSELKPAVKKAFKGWEKGGYSDKISEDNRRTVYRVLEYNKNRPLDLKNDWAKIEMFAKQQLTTKKMAQLVEQWRNEIYIQKYK